MASTFKSDKERDEYFSSIFKPGTMVPVSDREMAVRKAADISCQQSIGMVGQGLAGLGAASQLAGAQQAAQINAAAQGVRIGEDDLVIENSGSINLAVPLGGGKIKFYGDIQAEGKPLNQYLDSVGKLGYGPPTAREMLQQFVNNWLKGVKLP